MGIRTKQINLPELYETLDSRYGSAGEIKVITVPTAWNADGEYYVQTIQNIDELTADSKLIVKAKIDTELSYEDNLELENLFNHIVKIVPNEKSLTIYSCNKLETSFDIQIQYFN